MNPSVGLTSWEGFILSLIILTLCGFSLSLGQSAVLLANRLRPVRFFLALWGEGLVFAFGAFLWGLTIYAILNGILSVAASFGVVLFLVALGYTPYLLGFLVFLPYLGPIWHFILRLVVFFTLLVAVGVTFDLTFWSALLACGLGGLLLELIARIPFFQVNFWQELLMRRLTGRPELLTPTELADRMAMEFNQESKGIPGASS